MQPVGLRRNDWSHAQIEHQLPALEIVSLEICALAVLTGW
jgi:hypothetical protein